MTIVSEAMSLKEELKALNCKDFAKAIISTTTKQHGENRLLPFRQFGSEQILCIILTDREIAKQVLHYLDQYIPIFLVDVEQKQNINLWKIAQNTIKKGKIIPHKPNDITVEATYHLVNQYFNYKLDEKKILIYGTGNIATKLALRLAEVDTQIALTGRDKTKARQLINALNLILPSYNTHQIKTFSQTEKYDVLISAVSADHVLDYSYLDYLKHNTFVIDVGINNLTPNFIEKAPTRNISIMRLDVRIATPILQAHTQIANFPFFKKTAGNLVLQGVSCVAGGIIGKAGDVVLDTVCQPKHIIGIANGTGGLKKHEEYTDWDKHHLTVIKKTL
ncbi:shikimate 5-dehydrogenase [Legionella busanensis]|uniref:Shikimate 5-dehydrogenase n=1 Tax=Legionella busanensis TaxID=190655 RepID=A0A378JGI1_9GAMM|nr:hypothetical protein [Legionella busanensis]STX50224.1 shikimate 5-dehydrogenase [Legionella busanensis]